MITTTKGPYGKGMRDYNKAKPPTKKSNTTPLIKRIPLRYWMLSFILATGLAMHLSSQVWQNQHYHKVPAPSLVPTKPHTQAEISVRKGHILHSFYRALIHAGLSAKQALSLQKHFSPYINYNTLGSTDTFQVITNNQHKILAASIQHRHHRYALLLSPTQPAKFFAQSTGLSQQNFSLKTFYEHHAHKTHIPISLSTRTQIHEKY